MPKNETNNSENTDILYFVYDGECPICRLGADIYRIRQNVGIIQTIDARSEREHSIINEINQAKLDLDQGMVIKYKNELYHGKAALNLMAKLGANQGLFNRMNKLINKNPKIANLTYPPLKAFRNLLLRLLGVKKLKNLENNER